jgi:hypothetical protein
MTLEVYLGSRDWVSGIGLSLVLLGKAILSKVQSVDL